MPEPDRILLLCTAHLQADFDRFARLGTLLRRERQAAAGAPVFVLDLGDSGADGVWLCQATEGRAPFVVLDAVGYDLAVTGKLEGNDLTPEALEMLRDTVAMTLLPWQASARLARGDVAFEVTTGGGERSPFVRLDLDRATVPEQGSPLSEIGDVPPRSLLRLVVAWPEWQVRDVALLDIDAAAPDPVVQAAIDFVMSEARAYAQRKGESHDSG